MWKSCVCVLEHTKVLCNTAVCVCDRHACARVVYDKAGLPKRHGGEQGRAFDGGRDVN